MRPRLFILFLMIVLLPSTALVYLGMSLKKNEEAAIRQQLSDLMQQQLVTVEENISQVITKRERQLLPLMEVSPNDWQELRRLSREHPYVRQIFIRDDRGDFVFPPVKQKQLSRNEKQFFERTQTLWQSGEVFYQPDDSINFFVSGSKEKKVPTSSTLKKRSTVNQGEISKLKSVALAQFESGWFTWFQGMGQQFILWKRDESGLLTAIEINRERLMADIIAALPDSVSRNGSRICLHNASGQIYSWGDYDPLPGEEARSQRFLSAPLQSWNLLYYSNGSHTGVAGHFNLIISGSSFALVLALLCFYFYRENARQLHESLQKVNFVNQVSHELKTPLTNIRLYAEMLERRLDESDDRSRRHLGIIVSESQRLSRLISNVLSFAREDKQKLKLNLRRTIIDQQIDNVLLHFTPLFDKKNIHIDVRKNATDEVLADSDALEQILGNLLSNVEKYVPAGGHLTISSDQSEGGVRIVVSDNGPGIPVSQRHRIFEDFHRLSSLNNDGVSGTGIGLSISRRLARLHGGDLILQDTAKGASFVLTIAQNIKED